MIKPYVINNPCIHTMENNLYKYLEIKMHNLIRDRNFKKIIVLGDYDRSSIISDYEKKDKKFNWHRPTAEVKGNTLFIKCFPGYDYVMHYGSLIATYLAINNRYFNHVFYVRPTEKECNKPIKESNLIEMDARDIVVLGFGLETIAGESDWLGNGSFLYKNIKIHDKDATFIGCKHSLWGDIIGRVTRSLADKLNIKKVIYIGKLGSVNHEFIPNKYLATGNSSYLNEGILKWKDIFESVDDPILKRGIHYTSPSTIFETKEWFNRNNDFDFVDPEIGHTAKAAIDSGIDFSYLHIISNNLSKICSENLSNERLKSVIDKRNHLLLRMKEILDNII